jgi:hypothetical protein
MIMSNELKNEVISMKRSGTCTNPLGEFPGPDAREQGEIGSSPKSTRTYTRHNLFDIFEFIVTYKLFHDGNSPTVREIGNACKISSSSVVTNILHRLESQGKIRLIKNGSRHRSIQVVGGKWRLSAET